jgi:hypothetical protein
MNVRFWSDWCLDPRASKMNKFYSLYLLNLKKQDLDLG